MAKSAGTISSEQITRFQKRATSHLVVSYILLAGVCALFAFAIYVFIFAQEIDRRKGSIDVLEELHLSIAGEELIVKYAEERHKAVSSEELLEDDATAQKYLEDAIALVEAKATLQLFQEQHRLMLDTGYVPELVTPRSKEELSIIARGKKEIEDLQKADLDRIRDWLEAGRVVPRDVVAAQGKLSQKTLERELYEQRTKVAPAAIQIKASASNLDTMELVRTSLVRFGGVAVTLFLISLLTPVYRYNLRLGGYYLARADALKLAKETKVENFGELVRLLTPPYALEKEPTTPTESFVSLLKQARDIFK